MQRRFVVKLLTLAALAATTFAIAGEAVAQWKPTRAVRIVVPYGAGGTGDVIARTIASQMEKQTGWQVVVENKTGGAGAVGMQEIMRARPDGYTIGYSATSVVALDPFFPGANTPFTYQDYDYLATTGPIPFGMVVNKDLPFDDLKGMAEYSKTKTLRFLSAGRPVQLAMDQMGETFGIKFVTSNTPSVAEAIPQIMGGHADLTIDGGFFVAFVKDGRVKMITILDTERPAYAPNVRTLEEQGGKIPFMNYRVFITPKGVPADARAALAEALDKAINTPEVKAHHDTIFNPVRNLGPEGSQKDVVTQAEKWKAYFADKK